MKKTIILLLTAITISVTACASTEEDKTEYAKTPLVKDTTMLDSDIQKFLTGTEASQLETFNDDVEILYDDTVYSENIDGNSYLSRDAYYYEFGDNMYRFQLDYNGNVTSYIHYNKIGD